MPDDHKYIRSDFPDFLARKSDSSDDLTDTPDACFVMARWREDWIPPETFGPFPLLDICPDAPAYFANAGHYTTRDLRVIASVLRLDHDLPEPEAIYRAILKRAENAPWAFAVLDFMVAKRRLDARSPRSRKPEKISQVVVKRPLAKLRMSSHPELHGRLDELLVAPVAPDVAVAAYCEYALTAFQALPYHDNIGIENVISDAMKIFAYDGPEAVVETGLGPIEEVTDWLVHGTKIVYSMKKYPGATSATIRRHVVEALREIVNLLVEHAGDPEMFNLLAELAAIGSEQANRLRISQRDDVLAELGELGISHDPETLSDEAVHALSTALDEGLAAILLARKAVVAEAQEIADNFREQVQAASQNENYTLLAQVAPQASDAKAALAAAQAEHSLIMAVVTSLASGKGIDHGEVLSVLRTLVMKTEPKDESPSDVHDVLCDDADDIEDVSEAQDSTSTEFDACSATEAADLDPEANIIDEDSVKAKPEAPDEGVATAEFVGASYQEVGTKIEFGAHAPVVLEPGSRVPKQMPEPSPTVEPNVDTDNSSAPGGDAVLSDGPSPASAIGRESVPAKVVPAPADLEPAVPVALLADLIERDLVGIAADVAEVFESDGKGWPMTAAVLRTAAGSRAPHREYAVDTQQFLTIANRAMGMELDDLSSVLVLGALIRPAVLEKSSGFRTNLGSLCRGSLGQHLQKAVEAISELDYDFPPEADELARLSGAQRAPQRQRVASQLREWCDNFGQKTSRWPFTTAFMHHVVSDKGLIGATLLAIEAGEPEAILRARKAIFELSSQSKIESYSEKFASEILRNEVRIYPKGIDYLHRQFDEPLRLLDGWVRAIEREGSHGHKSESRLRATIGNLQSRLEKAMQGLAREGEKDDACLPGAVGKWITLQIRETLLALHGADTGSFNTLEEALTAERDLLPAAARQALDSPELRFNVVRDVMLGAGIPTPDAALVRAREEAAFDTAFRLAERFNINAQADIRRDMIAYAEIWRAEVMQRERRLKTLAKVDYKHQDRIIRHLSWCDIALARLAAIKDGSETHDLADVPAQTRELDRVSSDIETSIRNDQLERINQYRSEQNTDEADALISMLDDLTIETIEDRIAQLRDGRSAATFETELQGMVSEFTPGFLTVAASPQWPVNNAGFQKAVALDGPLFIEEDRRAAGLDFINLYRDITGSMKLRKPTVAKIREFFEEAGFERVKVQDLRQVGRTDVWQAILSATIQSVRSDNWFLPPVFGSQSAGYRLILVGPDVLPELVTKSLSAEMPAILLMAGVADLAKRQELAERLRASAIPALVVDEALVAFTATLRHTRARTIFECGLPYGRVEPYTTDAGSLPPEMFFGRDEEIRYIMSKTADGCLVYGGRQLGKSALLGHVARTRHKPEENQFVIRRDVKSLGNSEKTTEIWAHLAGMLSPEVVRTESRTAENVSRDIRAWVNRNPQGRIICMFDEADHFMDADTRHDYPELSKIKELMEDTGRAFKVVFAGLHNVQRIYVQPNSPLAHLGRPICIGPLNRTDDDKRAAHDLVVNPMRAAGFRFEAREAVEEILAWANYYPSLVQEYMKGLLATLHGSGSGKAYKLPNSGPLWPISSDTLFTHRGFHHIESRIREKFHLTLNLDPRYALVAYTLGRLNAEGNEHMARVSGYRPEELLEEAKIFWPKTSELPSLAAFEALLEELFDLGVLGRVPIPQTQRHLYLLGSRQVAAMLGSAEDIYHALAEIEEKDPAVAYDRSIHRRRYAPGASQSPGEAFYAPLTDLQIERIVHPEAAPVQIVCGLDLLGLSKVGNSLKRISETGRLPGAQNEDIPVHVISSRNDLRGHLDRTRAGGRRMAVLVYTPESAKDAHDVITWLERHPRVLDSQVRPVIILDASDDDMRGLASRRHDQSQFLAAWGAEMIRVHLHHIEKTELDIPALRRAVLTAAGGIPAETIKLIKAMRTATDPAEVAKEWKVTLHVPPNIIYGTLGKALGVLDVAEGGEYDDLNDLMREHVGRDLVDVGPDLIATGLVARWHLKSGQFPRSALGDLVAQRTAT